MDRAAKVDTLGPPSLQERASRVAREVAAPAADDVDRGSRFPVETLDSLRSERLLSAAVPVELGGDGASLTELSTLCEALARKCSASGMILAMHYIQVGSIARHAGNSAYLHGYLADLARSQFLIASATSEVGVGGDLRSSKCAVETDGDRFTLNKCATTISYGAQADDILVSARRAPDAAPGDQALVLVRKKDYTLKQTSAWDTLGMRGTCSPGFELESTGETGQILPESFGIIATQTMVPWSHLLWAATWTGIARGAVAKTRAFVRAQARSKPGSVPPTAHRLAEVVSALQAMQSSVDEACADYEAIAARPDAAETLASLGFALRINNLKIATSQQAPIIIGKCLEICGIQGYKNDSPYAMGRPLRDSLSAALMIGNDRILATNASLLLVHKDE